MEKVHPDSVPIDRRRYFGTDNASAEAPNERGIDAIPYAHRTVAQQREDAAANAVLCMLAKPSGLQRGEIDLVVIGDLQFDPTIAIFRIGHEDVGNAAPGAGALDPVKEDRAAERSDLLETIAHFAPKSSFELSKCHERSKE
jgi:hypothetical protein